MITKQKPHIDMEGIGSCRYVIMLLKKKGTKLHFKSPTAKRRNVLCVGVGHCWQGSNPRRPPRRTPGGAGYVSLCHLGLGGAYDTCYEKWCEYHRCRAIQLIDLKRPPLAYLAKAGMPCSAWAGGVDSIPANSDAQNVPSFRCWWIEMNLSPFIENLMDFLVSSSIRVYA
jgi:hypothetical protein